MYSRYDDGHSSGGSKKRKKAGGGVWYVERRTIARSSGSAGGLNILVWQCGFCICVRLRRDSGFQYRRYSRAVSKCMRLKDLGEMFLRSCPLERKRARSDTWRASPIDPPPKTPGGSSGYLQIDANVEKVVYILG